MAARAGSPGGHAPVDAAAGRDQLQRQHQFLGTETGRIGVPMFHITQILLIFHIVHLQQTLEDLEGDVKPCETNPQNDQNGTFTNPCWKVNLWKITTKM